jgi:exopolysaccharide production protein ExoZ
MQNSARLWLNAQAMRLFAAFFIVYIHLEPILDSVGGNANIIYLLRIGTDCFLVLTAFLSVYRNPFGRERPIDWLWKRFIRIIPLYWLLTLIFFFSKNLLLGIKNHDTFEHLLYSLFFIPYGLVPVLFPGWSLTLILEFSIILAISHYVFPGNSSLIASLFAGALAVWGSLAKPESPIWAMYTNPMLVDFFFGGILAVVIVRIERAPPFWIRFSGIVSFALAGIILFLTRHVHLELPRVATLGAPALLIVAGCLLLECGEWRVKSKWITIAARYTFCVYLGHMFWDICLDVIAAHTTTSITITLLILTPIPVVLGSMLLHHLIELPLRKLVDRLPPWFMASLARTRSQSLEGLQT